MIKSLQDARTVDGLPLVLRKQPWVQALSAALGITHERTIRFADESQIFTRLDTVPEVVLDAVAANWNVAWYDTGYTLEQKRRVLKTAIAVRKMIGTAAAVKLQMNAVWPGTQVREWFEYGGEPGYFRVETQSPELVEELEQFLETLDAVKRYSVQLDRITVRRHSGLTVRTGFAIRVRRKIIIECEIPPELDATSLTDEKGNTLVTEQGNVLIA